MSRVSAQIRNFILRLIKSSCKGILLQFAEPNFKVNAIQILTALEECLKNRRIIKIDII